MVRWPSNIATSLDGHKVFMRRAILCALYDATHPTIVGDDISRDARHWLLSSDTREAREMAFWSVDIDVRRIKELMKGASGMRYMDIIERY